MNNETYSHNMLETAVKDFPMIAQKGHDLISLADITAYQKNGNANQKQVGQFLSDNFGNLTYFDHAAGEHTGLKLEDLKTAEAYTASDKTSLQKTQSDAMRSETIKDAAITAGVMGPILGYLALGAPPAAPEAAVIVVATAFLGGFYGLASTAISQGDYAEHAQRLHQ